MAVALAVLITGTLVLGWGQAAQVQEGEPIKEIKEYFSKLLINDGKTQKINLTYVPKINADEKHTQIILSVLNNIDEDVVRHIASIYIVDSTNDVSLKCGSQALGCALTSNGNTDIFMPSVDNFKDSCSSFEHVLYHEIGHVEYNTKHQGELPTDREIEYYVENFADKHKKDNCITKSLRLFH